MPSVCVRLIKPAKGGGGGVVIRFWPVQPVGEGGGGVVGCCLLSANSASGGCACM